MRKAYKKIKVYPSQKTGKVWAYSKNKSGNRTWGKIQKDDRGYCLDSGKDGFGIGDNIYLSDGREVKKTKNGYVFLTSYNGNWSNSYQPNSYQSNSYQSNSYQSNSYKPNLNQQSLNQQESGQQKSYQQESGQQESGQQSNPQQEIIDILKDINKMITLLIKIIERG